jgi:hypothetical protein
MSARLASNLSAKVLFKPLDKQLAMIYSMVIKSSTTPRSHR